MTSSSEWPFYPSFESRSSKQIGWVVVAIALGLYLVLASRGGGESSTKGLAGDGNVKSKLLRDMLSKSGIEGWWKKKGMGLMSDLKCSPNRVNVVRPGLTESQ